MKLMYAIAFDFDTEKLKNNYPGPSYTNAYGEVRKFLAEKGFSHQQGSLYYGDVKVTQVSAMIAVLEMSEELGYLRDSVADIRILQLLNADDLMPIVIKGHKEVLAV